MYRYRIVNVSEKRLSLGDMMKRKDLTPEQRAWEDYKFITFNSGMIAFGLGAVTIIFIKETFFYPMLLVLVHPIIFFFAFKYLPKKFLKKEIKLTVR